MKTLLRMWGESTNKFTRIDAFLRIRQMTIELPPALEMLEMALKGLYLTYVRNSRFFNAQEESSHNFMQVLPWSLPFVWQQLIFVEPERSKYTIQNPSVPVNHACV